MPASIIDGSIELAGGRDVYGFAGNNQKIFLIPGSVNMAWIALILATRGGVPLLGVA